MKKILAVVGVMVFCGALVYGISCTKVDSPEALDTATIEAEEVVPLAKVPAPEKVAPEAEEAK
jgi:hypothetical protein